MIIGNGLMARVFAGTLSASTDVVIHAAGVSNSQCRDTREFRRETALLTQTLAAHARADCLVYFSTCSVLDPSAATMPYVQHKLAMEAMVRAHPGHLVLRLPQIAGRTPNPHTLLNYLHARIARGERFTVWRHARRNVIDCDDVRLLACALIEDGMRGATVNIAAPESHEMTTIVATMERVIDGHAVFDLADEGADYPIDIDPIRRLFDRCELAFGRIYLESIIRKYYGASD